VATITTPWLMGLWLPAKLVEKRGASPPRGGLLCDAGIGADAGGESVDATEGVKISVHGSPRRSLCPCASEVVAQSRYKFFGRNAKRLTHSQHREYRYRRPASIICQWRTLKPKEIMSSWVSLCSILYDRIRWPKARKYRQ